jgi:UDP:flavonoid glycosyltransferase YjiC (YdhE family)
MVNYAFMNFPTFGQLNPTLAVVEELVERGQEVVYFLPESFRSLIEHTGASFHPIEPSVYAHLRAPPAPATGTDDNRRLAGLPIRMLKESRQALPPLLASVETLAAAVARVSSEPGFKQRAREMQQQVRAAGGYRAAVDAILANFQRKRVTHECVRGAIPPGPGCPLG